MRLTTTSQKWVETNMPEVMNGPCENVANTPSDCARAMTQEYKRFFASAKKED